MFDLDGVLIDSETTWAEVRRDYVRDCGGVWSDKAQAEMMGMSSIEWARYLHEQLGVRLLPDRIVSDVVARMEAEYRRRLPLLPGATDAVERMAARWPLGLASSANRPLIDQVLGLSGLNRFFAVSVSSEEVMRGKPAPDVYLSVLELLDCRADAGAAIEDSTNGLRSAAAAGMRVIAVPNAHFPPSAEALSLADVVISDLDHLTEEVVDPTEPAGGPN